MWVHVDHIQRAHVCLGTRLQTVHSWLSQCSGNAYLVMFVSSGRRLLPERSRRSATAAFVSSRDSDPRSHLRRNTRFSAALTD